MHDAGRSIGLNLTAAPYVSVLLAVHNGQDYLSDAVASIVRQSWRDWELVAVDDGSTDETGAILASFDDERIRVVSTHHVGLAGALNAGLQECRGQFIARMDADDTAEPDRLAVQIDFLEKHPDVGIVCSDIYTMDGMSRITGTVRMRSSQEKIRRGLLFEANAKPIVHPSVMMRRDVPERLGGYRDITNSEDHDFWLRAIDIVGIHRIDRCLLRYRINRNGVSQKSAAQQITSACMSVVVYHVKEATGVDLFDRSPELYRRLESVARRRAEATLAPTRAAMQRVRDHLRAGAGLSVAREAFNAARRHGFLAFPWINMQAHRRLTRALAKEALRELEMSEAEVESDV